MNRDASSDPARWPVSTFVRDFMPAHWDGRVVLLSMAINWTAALLTVLAMLLASGATALAWIHVLLFGAMPVVGFVWFVRDSVSWRARWQVWVACAVQVFVAALPGFVLLRSVWSAAA
jgi:hypothetical protein